MKAWMAMDRIDRQYVTVVFAETRGKAKVAAQGTNTCEDLDYMDIRVIRFPELDGYYRGHDKMDWYDPEDRKAMVKIGGMECDDSTLDICNQCSAREWCGRYEYLQDEQEDWL